MTYRSKSTAETAAAILNLRLGFPRARAVWTLRGWTVIASYAYGLSGQS